MEWENGVGGLATDGYVPPRRELGQAVCHSRGGQVRGEAAERG